MIMQRLVSRQKGRKLSATSFLKACSCGGVFCWCLSLFWISKHTSQHAGGDAVSWRTNHPEIDYEIPLDMVPTKPVKVANRDYSRERIWTKDGRRAYISSEAMREYGDEVRFLIQAGRENLLNGEGNTTFAFRQRLRARAPWLKGDPRDSAWPYNTIPEKVNGQAIVICAGNPQLHYLKNLVYSVRADHGSPMPIRIVFLDDDDLKPPARLEVESVIPAGKPKNIEFLNLSDFFNLKEVDLKGWDLKAYGLLAVKEFEVVFVDVDVMLLQPPEMMFQQKGYKDTGALFYHDRMLMKYLDFLYDPPTFAEAMQPNLSPIAQKLIHNGGKSPYRAEHIQESGMIVLDKRRRILGLWATCLIYGREDIRKYSQGYHMYGDKEMYWISFETVQEPYSFARYYPGAIGGVTSDFEFLNIASMPTDSALDIASKLEDSNANHMGLCGRLAHFDDSGLPLWSNGGYLTKEDDWPSINAIGMYPLNPIWYVDGGDWLMETFVPEVTLGVMDRLFSWLSTQVSIAETYTQWEQLKNSHSVNQYWRIQEDIGVNCLMPNSRGIQQIPESVHVLALKSVQRYFLEELGKQNKYEKYF